MKKFFYLMSVVCLMMAASCEKPENGNNEKPQTEPPVVTVPEGVKTAGAELVLTDRMIRLTVLCRMS